MHFPDGQFVGQSAAAAAGGIDGRLGRGRVLLGTAAVDVLDPAVADGVVDGDSLLRIGMHHAQEQALEADFFEIAE